MATDDDIDELEDEAPRPRTSGLTIILCVLNVLAAVGFTYLLVLDYTKRQAWSHAVFMHDLKVVGLPLKDELTEGTSVSRLIVPKHNLDKAALKAVYTKRGGKSVSEDFQSLQEAFQYRILPEHLTTNVLNEQFQGAGQQVKTLDDEIARVRGTVLDDIAKAATELADGFKKEAGKRTVLTRLLMDLARSTDLVGRLEQRIKKAPAKDLDNLIADAAQRRMLVDILAPLEVYRGARLKPIDEKAPTKKLKLEDLDNAQILDRAADLELVKVKTLEEMLTRRLDAAVAEKFDPGVHFGKEWGDQPQSAVDRRKAIANILCVIAHVAKPGVPYDAKEPTRHLLYAEGPERVMAVVGVYEYTLAYQNLTGAFLVLRPHVLALLEADREGVVHEGDAEKRRLGGFVQNYNSELHDIRLLINTITKEEKRLADLRNEAKGHQDILAERTKQVNYNSQELLKARAKTAEQLKELERLQRELFEAQQALVNAVQVNERLLNLIREAEGLRKRRGS